MANLTKQILELASKGPCDLAEADRAALLQASFNLVDALENPMEKMLRMFLVSLPYLVLVYSCLYIL
jgi:hypothetical protein